MQKRTYIPLLLAAALLTFLPARTGKVLAQSAICGTFSDVPSSSVYCPFILEAFITNITQGTSATTFNPNDNVNRNQAATFLTRTMDGTLHRASIRSAIGKSWSPTSSNGSVITDVGGRITDIVTDGTYLWIARADSKVLKVGAADRRSLETWTIPSNAPQKLGVFAGLVWIADDQGNLYNFNPTGTAGAASPVLTNFGIPPGPPTLAFDGSNVWWASANGTKIAIYPVASPGNFTFSLGTNVNIDGMVFDGTNMWVLTSDSRLSKLNIPSSTGAVPTVVETVTIPGVVNDCRMLYDGGNIWVPIGTTGTLYVIRPSPGAGVASLIVKNEAIPDVAYPYVAAFDTENVMIAGLNNGSVALYKATSLTHIRTVGSPATGVRGLASDGRTFNLGDTNLTKFYQF
ncbi:MAG TPA: S-layer homology domain-containing protein [Bryobacteraceae bacterium]|nr:S-layer homology domain-containing protein [Bryobacteraceae bacterium]